MTGGAKAAQTTCRQRRRDVIKHAAGGLSRSSTGETIQAAYAAGLLLSRPTLLQERTDRIPSEEHRSAIVDRLRPSVYHARTVFSWTERR